MGSGVCPKTTPWLLMRISAWNYQGIGKSLTARALRAMIKSRNPQIMFLSKTKCLGNEFLKKAGIRRGWNVKVVDSIGNSRGLALVWKHDIEIRVSELNPRFIIAKITDCEENKKWKVSFVYGEPAKESRLAFYDFIISKISIVVGPLLCIGDWNCLWDRGDKSGGNCIPNSCLRNAHRILDGGKLMDLGHHGPHFTWVNRQSGNRQIKERFDRATINEGWKSLYP